MVVESVGFLAAYDQPGSLPPLLAGTLGALVTVWVTFLPCFLFIFLGAPAVVLNLAVWFAVHTALGTVDDRVLGPVHLPVPQWSSVRVASVAISAVAVVLVFRFRVGTMRLVALAAVAGAGLAALHLL